jgi:hypothetical protein
MLTPNADDWVIRPSGRIIILKKHILDDDARRRTECTETMIPTKLNTTRAIMGAAIHHFFDMA